MADGYIKGKTADADGDYQLARSAVLQATLCFPPIARARARTRLIGALDAEFQEIGFSAPPWLQRLREEFDAVIPDAERHTGLQHATLGSPSPP